MAKVGVSCRMKTISLWRRYRLALAPGFPSEDVEFTSVIFDLIPWGCDSVRLGSRPRVSCACSVLMASLLRESTLKCDLTTAADEKARKQRMSWQRSQP